MLNIYNIVSKKFYPLDCFSNLKNSLDIINNYKYKRNFFPFPIMFPILKSDEVKLKKKNNIDIFYKNTKICNFVIDEIFNYNLKKKIKNIFFTNDIKHPGFMKMNSPDNLYLSGNIANSKEEIFIQILNTKKFSFVQKLLKPMNVVAFHSRNIPHLGHEWIHRYCLSRFETLFLNPIIGDSKNDDFSERQIIKAYKKYKNIFPSKRVIFYPHYCSVFFAGPREALLHLVIRRNYNCDSMVIGRDHSGVKNYYEKYAAQKLAKKYKKKIGINIEYIKEPYYCKKCKMVTNELFCRHSDTFKLFISGTNIRKNIIKNIYDERFIRKELFI